MKKKIAILTSLVLVVLIISLAINSTLFRTYLEVQVYETKKSPNGRWTAVVQLEVISTAFVSVPDWSVRLQGLEQKDRNGDLVMVVEANYPDPAPSIEWTDGKLIVFLTENQKYQYLATPVSGVDVIVQEK